MNVRYPALLLLLLACDLGAAPPSTAPTTAATTALNESVRYVRDGQDTIAAVVRQGAGIVHTNQVFRDDPRHMLTLLDGSIRNRGGDPSRVVRLHVVAASQEHADAMRAAIRGHYPPESRPPASFVVGALAMPKTKFGIDAVAIASAPPGAPRSVIYISGQAEKGASLAEATAKTLASLVRTLEFTGATPRDALHARCFLNPMSDVGAVVTELERTFGKKAFTASFVEWKSELPIEIELIASGPPAPAGAAAVEYLTPPGTKASPLFARVVRINRGDLVYTAGLYAKEPGDGEQQVLSIFQQLQDVLKQTRCDLRHLAKATYFVSDADASKKLNDIRPKFYDPARPPAASKALVPGAGMKDRSLAIDMIGVSVPQRDSNGVEVKR